MNKLVRSTFVLFVACIALLGCEGNTSDDNYTESSHPRTVSVEVHNYATGYSTSYGFADIYIGNAYEETLLSGQDTRIILSLLNNEEVPIKIVLYTVDGQTLQWEEYFDNEELEWHVNIYDDHVQISNSY